MTDKTIKAIRVLVDTYYGKTSGYKIGEMRPKGITAKQFAEEMWPDSPGWNRRQNVGTNGSTRGVCMPRAAGAVLSRLRDKGFAICHTSKNYIRLWKPTEKARTLANMETE